ncbi:hypothetical protein G6O69_32320 [Pseudenhygromyxa sp. WMMC2535]|uniref:hypothetical protein n=1 Tax=Pseudenhygromyxa sp. WMMC2535 TaxID=2712867 RepID=UPI0015578C5C|nr:hypothetical protein [Pseudenhygromyxa sp. WMMC2535]NVB42554.1 hypothetical protein [Pseudenhygromyxa sp. WMMC2535]
MSPRRRSSVPGPAPARLVLSCAAGLGACESDPRGPLDLSEVDATDQACVSVVHDRLELGEAVHAYLADGGSTTGGWALISAYKQNATEPELAIARVPASADEDETATVFLDLAPSFADQVELRAGVAKRSLWVLLDTPATVALLALEVGEGVVASNLELDSFPAFGGGSGCPGDWQRELLLIEGRPYLLAMPECVDGPELAFELATFDPETLDALTSWTLSFDPCALSSDPELCAAELNYTIEDIISAGTTRFPAASRVSVGFSQVRAFTDPFGATPDIRSTDLSVLDLRMPQSGPDARLLTFRAVWVQSDSVPLGLVEMSQDPYSIQLHARSAALSTDEALLRVDTISDDYLQTLEFVPSPGRGRLVQLASESAMMTADEDNLLAIPLIDAESWPRWTELELHTLEGMTGFEQAGVGHLLLHRSDDVPQVIRVDCIDG